jgi:predicted CXXCH cytochrome family protein
MWLTMLVTAQSGAPATERAYAGSEACRTCHAAQYAAWKQSLHVQMTKPIEQATVRGDFQQSEPFTQHGRTYATSVSGGHYAVSVTRPPAATETFPVDYTLGAKRFQGYISRLPDGRMYVLPVFWNAAWQRWLDWKEITPVPDGNRDLRQIWNVNCFNCHATNIQRNFDTGTRRFSTTWTEMGIGCESCHGPGAAHAADPPDHIVSMRRASPRQVFDTCAYCHGNKTNYFTGFVPGDRLDDFAQPALISDPVPASDPQGEFWPDGRPSRFNRPQALTQSGCFRAGAIACTSCHVAHGSANAHSLKVPIEQSDRLCTQCHTVRAGGPGEAGGAGGSGTATPVGDLSAHTHHAPASQGSRCIECHMSNVNWRMLTRRRDHTFAAPVPELTARYGIPNACTSCHEERTPEWAASTMDTWYGDRARREKAARAADAIYGGGSGDAGSIGALAALAVDQTQGAFLRASAAGFLPRLPSAAADATARASLVTATADPEAIVRIAAVRALGTLGGDTAPAALLARLRDPSRVVRANAAEALLGLGIVTLGGAEGAALTRAQAEYATSLRTFPDSASHQASFGWLQASLGLTADAARSLELARSLDANDPRPLVYLGVLAAQGERYADAIALWQQAQTLDPRYPSIDRMITEAQARVSPR